VDEWSRTLAPLRMPDIATVVGGVGATVVGMGLSPVVIGALNDILEPRLGQAAIRNLAALYFSVLAAGASALISTRWLNEDCARAADAQAETENMPLAKAACG